MRRGFGFAGFLLTVILLVIVGAIAYNVGWSDGVSTHLPAGAAAAPPYYYGYGWHGFGGFGALFGLFWFVLIVFGIVWLFRLAFFGFGHRMWSGGGRYGRGWGYGPGTFEERAQEWHRRQHGEQPPSSPTPPPPPAPPDTRSV